MVPITGSPATAGTGAVLPNVPNSMRFDSTGATVFLGTQKGLMRIAASANPPTITNLPTITGKVLAVSPSGTRLIIADTLSPVQQVFIFDATSGVSTHLLINGATAAGFSPDGLKAFIVTPTNLYVHSAQAPLQVGTLASPAVDVSFLANGMFGFVAEGAAGSDYLATCDDPSVSLTSQIIHLPSAAATAIRALPDGSGFLGLAPPDLNLITIPPAGPAPTPGQSGCPSPLGSLTISPTVTPIPLGQGAFTPVAFIVASDGQKVFIVPDSGNIIVYDVLSNVISFLSLTGSPHPLAASLTPDSQLLYVSADDGKVHVINTVAGGDLQQIAVPSSSLCNVTSGGPPPTCLPDLLQVRP
jgi:hypothetical protein